MSELNLQFEVSKPALRGDEIWHVGVSGGKDSAAALKFMVGDSGIPTSRIVATWCDIKNDHDLTQAHVQWLSNNVHPVETIHPELGFFDLAFSKRRFPSQGARFCTEELKIIPTAEYLLRLKLAGHRVISVAGTRAEESDERAKLSEWDFSGSLLCWQWRPLLKWTLNDVLAYHTKHSIPLNPLYARGAKRVGCWPCFMCQKEEVRNIAITDPDRIDTIEREENKFEESFGRYSSFFARDKVPLRFRSKKFRGADGKTIMVATIRDVVRWSMTGKRAKGHYTDNTPKEGHGCTSGYCE